MPSGIHHIDNIGLASLRLAVLVPVTSRGSGCDFSGAHSDTYTGEFVQCTIEGLLSGLAKLAASFTRDGDADAGTTTLCATGNKPPCQHAGAAGYPGDAAGTWQARVIVVLGIDASDEVMLQHKQDCVDVFTTCGILAEAIVLNGHRPGAVCQIWSDMAAAAAAVKKYDCQLAVLLGDDIEMSPPGWPEMVIRRFQQSPDLMALLLRDASDPGFPSFPVLRVDWHLKVFGKLLPDCFINQGGDPYLAAVYRRWQGCLAMQPDITVTNKMGGVQRSEQPYQPPRYVRNPVSKESMLAEIKHSTQVLQQSTAIDNIATLQGRLDRLPKTALGDNSLAGGHVSAGAPREGLEISPAGEASQLQDCPCRKTKLLAVDVLVPTFRVDVDILKTIAAAVLESPAPKGAVLQLILVVDQPYNKLSRRQRDWLNSMQERWLNKIRIRYNEDNLGASATRNRALQESLADFVIFWDDDIIPDPGCLSAYVEAMLEHPEGLGFVGPSYVPKDPDNLWSCAVHQADVLFFWDAAADWKVAHVIPWAVTANVALINSHHEFDLRFPKTGGGEDIDYCLKVAGGKLIPVPLAAVHHPLWNQGRRCYNRFFGWAYGDGALIALYPELCYYNWPNSAETCCWLLAAALVLLAAAVLLGVSTVMLWVVAAMANSLAESRLLPTAGYDSHAFLYCCLTLTRWVFWLLSSAIGFKTVDLLLDIVRAFHPVRVGKHPCRSFLLRAAAAAEASCIKTWSEVGRLWGQICRRELLAVQHQPVVDGTISAADEMATSPSCLAIKQLRRLQVQIRLLQRFDWFCGLSAAVVEGEKRRGICRFAACCLGAWIGITVSTLLTNTIIASIDATSASAAYGVKLMLNKSCLGSTVGWQLWTASAVLVSCAVALWGLEA